MLYLNSNILKHMSIITLYVNGLNTPTKKIDCWVNGAIFKRLHAV